MPARMFITILVLLLFGDVGTDEGRRGNALYEAGNYAEAAAAYRAALEDLDGETGAVATGLWNNLGAALHQLERYDEAAAAFERAIEAAETSDQRARALYNAGNNAEAQEQTEAALAFYREALLADPAHEDARFNYEYLQRERSNDAQNDGRQRRSSDRDEAPPEPQRGDSSMESQRDDAAPEQQDDASGRPEDERRTGGSEQPDPSATDAESEPSDPQEHTEGPELSPEQAARILRALENQEKQLLRQIQKRPPQPRRIEKEW